MYSTAQYCDEQQGRMKSNHKTKCEESYNVVPFVLGAHILEVVVLITTRAATHIRLLETVLTARLTIHTEIAGTAAL